MILEKAIVPDIKDGCPTKEDWEARRKLILNTLSEIEYGKRPAVDYAVTWKELLREEMERLAKQRKREKSYREKRKAKKIAENGGEIVKKKVCPHCGKEFTPASNRQIFCTKECCNQARQDKVKADRVAEKGDHYYRQRQCEVCGSIYWPTHSQQKFCSEKCKKINHNKKTLEFYHKKQKEKEQCKVLSQMKEPVSSTNSSEITTIPA